jgi:hypothetical protein
VDPKDDIKKLGSLFAEAGIITTEQKNTFGRPLCEGSDAAQALVDCVYRKALESSSNRSASTEAAQPL